MSDSITVEGIDYISSKRAAELSGYAHDYVGQLARSGQIDAQRIGGLWYVSIQSLDGYKLKAEAYKPEPPTRNRPAVDPEALISFDGKDYISAARAAKLTGYHQDYVGQLARSGAILSRQVGNRWYVEREGILVHKKSKDELLAAVQTESVGLLRRTPSNEPTKVGVATAPTLETLLSYTNENEDLMPTLESLRTPPVEVNATFARERKEEKTIPIRVVRRPIISHNIDSIMPIKSTGRAHGKTKSYAVPATSALSIVIVLSFGFITLKTNSIYSAGRDPGITGSGSVGLTASAGEAFSLIGDTVENVVTHELVYRRAD